MNIPEAIKVLTVMGTPDFDGHTEDILAARKLGIKALERELSTRPPGKPEYFTLLEGETEE